MIISIMGDSISTFESFNPDGYCVFYDEQMQYINGLTLVNDTWWAQVIQALHGELCVNNSYSGSKVSGEGFPLHAVQNAAAAFIHHRILPISF